MVKRVMLATAAFVATAIVGFQWLSLGSHIPDGPRALVISAYVGQAALAIGLLAAPYLIPKANRSIHSYLKAYTLLMVLASFGGCGTWMSKFHGEDKVLESAAGLSLTVPSDWAPAKAPTGLDFFVMDWAGTNSVGISMVDSKAVPTQEEDVTDMLASLLDPLALGDPGERFECGDWCRGKQFRMQSNGRAMRLLLAAKYDNGRWLMLNSGIIESFADEAVPVAVRVMASAK